MAITFVTKVRSFNIDSITNQGSEEYNIYFDEFTSHPQMASECLGAVDPNTSLTTPYQKGQKLDSVFFPDAIVDGLNAFPRDGQNLVWRLDVSYGEFELDSETGDSGDPIYGEYPWERPKSYNWSHYFDQAIMAVDKAGKPMLNSAGDRFETDVIVDRTIRTCQISFATPLSRFDPIESGKFINSVNSIDVTIAGSVFPKKTIKCYGYDSGVEVATVSKGNTTREVMFNQTTVSLAYDPFTWDGIIMDIGNNDINGKRIVRDNLVGFANPQRLNGGGIRLVKPDGTFNGLGVNLFDANGKPNTLLTDEDRSIEKLMAFLNYQKYDEMDLNKIGF
jgi:hypothetical protein